MILVDTSVWINHLRSDDVQLKSLLIEGQVLTHPFVIGELALGNLKQRDAILQFLTDLPSATLADNDEVLKYIKQNSLNGVGIGYIDTHLLASAKLSKATLWTEDTRLQKIATQLGLSNIK
ncbi:MAG: type II toxin-antitoxin system VapC family toxin [Alphaproteobacteria bacterium]|jgi:predicted nucleic acid-binding protein